MKVLKLSVLILLLAFLGLMIYANVRPYNPSEKLPAVSMSQFTLTPITDTVQFDRVTKSIDKLSGVNAVSLKMGSNTAAVMYCPDKTSPNEVMKLLSDDGRIKVSENDLLQCGKRGCPVMGPMARIDDMIASLNFRK